MVHTENRVQLPTIINPFTNPYCPHPSAAPLCIPLCRPLAKLRFGSVGLQIWAHYSESPTEQSHSTFVSYLDEMPRSPLPAASTSDQQHVEDSLAPAGIIIVCFYSWLMSSCITYLHGIPQLRDGRTTLEGDQCPW